MASASGDSSLIENVDVQSQNDIKMLTNVEEAAAASPQQQNVTKPGTSTGIGTGMDKGFYQHFMNPMMSKMQEQVQKNNAMLDEIHRKMEEEREDNRKKKLSEHIPTTIQGPGQELKTIIKHIEDMIVYENYEDNDNKDANKFIKARLKQLDENSEVAILSHSIGAFVSTLEPQHLRHFTSRIVSDVTLWMSRLFRFPDSHAYFHEEEREGLVRICRLALHQKYPKFATDGYEALFSRPPMFYVSAAAKPLLGQFICAQLGLPISCLSTVPCSNQLGSVQKIQVDNLKKQIEEDKAAGKSPVLLVAYAGTPIVGNTDSLQDLQGICKKEEIWLHLEGNNLATLTMYSVPTEILPAKASDSMTLNLNGWLGLPAVPYVTLYKSIDTNLARTIGLAPANRFRLNCVPLWTCLQNLGHEGVVARIKYSLDLSKMVHQFVEKLPSLVNVSKRRKKDPTPEEKERDNKISITGLLSRAVNALILFEIENPCSVFRYQPQLTGTEEQATPDVQSEADEKVTPVNEGADPYFDALNIWLYETLRRDSPRVHITAVELDGIGVSIRFAPVESGQMFDTTKEDLQQFLASLDRQVKILDATVDQRQDFQNILEAQDNMRIVDLPNWAGLGAVQYISEHWLDKLENLTDVGKNELNALNINLVHQLKSADTAFSLGQTDDGMNCVRFGLITEETDLEELIALVYTTGKEVEESSKFLETMAEVVRQGIEKANEDLHKETQNKLQQEGVLRQVPLVGSLFNWLAPVNKDENNLKGCTFNLASGKIQSTESTYKYHMQVQEATSDIQPCHREGPLKLNLKPAKRRSHSRSHSNTSENSAASPQPPIEEDAAVPLTTDPIVETNEQPVEPTPTTP